MLVLVGSRALGWPGRVKPDTDWDWLRSDPCFVPLGDNVEVFTDPRIGEWNWGNVATLDELYTLKISHSAWDIGGSWNKHACDIMQMKSCGAQFIPELYEILRPIWKDQHGRKEVSLTQTKEKFFSDNVVRKYDHDSLHETVCYYDYPFPYPLYRAVLKPGSEVDCDWSVFEKLTHADQIKMIREEIYVTALERILLPTGFTKCQLFAYRWSLRRCATSLLKGRWQLFIMLNLSELWTPDIDYRALHRSRTDRLIPMEDA